MSNCYPIAGVISLKPLTGAQGGPSYCIYRALCWAFLHTWLLSHPVKTQIICPRSYQKPGWDWTPSPSYTLLFSSNQKSWEARPCILWWKSRSWDLGSALYISALPSVWGCWVPPFSKNLQPLLLVPQTDQALFLQKWLSLYPRRMSSAGHHLRSILKDPGAVTAVVH